MYPLTATVSKEWHSTVTNDLRMHLIKKLVSGLVPDLHNEMSNRLAPVLKFVAEEEKKMFELAHSRAEYYEMIAQQIYRYMQVCEQMSQNPKEWQNNITEDLRQHLVEKIKNSIKSSVYGELPLDLAKSAEGSCYEKAANRQEYYQLIATKIYNMEKALETWKLNTQCTEGSILTSSQRHQIEAELMKIVSEERTVSKSEELTDLVKNFMKHSISDTSSSNLLTAGPSVQKTCH